jgi:phosphopantothenoylcysteine decarboxylase/phosphopantothenate--cysteine ligase
MESTRPQRLILGITGGIAAYKAAELVRLFIKQQVEVHVVMTEAACQFITPVTLQALSGHPVLVNQWDASENGMAHIAHSRSADAILIAPATADFIAKLAHGLADDLLSTLCLARDCPLLVAPAMNRQMWANQATQRNIAQLMDDGIQVLGPASGVQACGEEGIGRMWEPTQLVFEISSWLTARSSEGNQLEGDTPSATRAETDHFSKLLEKVNVVITAGPTYEAIDAVRGITNRSSGKMGYAIAQAALEMGANVSLISGPTALDPPAGAKVINITSAEEMFVAVKQQIAVTDIFIAVAAVADYRVAQSSEQKIKKSSEQLILELVPNPDILAYVAKLPHPPFCIGFAAESEKLREYAAAKRIAKNIPLLAANLAQHAIGANENELILFDEAGEHVLPRASKHAIGRTLLQHAVKLYRQGIKP